MRSHREQPRRIAFKYFGASVALEWECPGLDEELKALLMPIWQNQPDLPTNSVFKVHGKKDYRVEGPDDEVQRANRSCIFETIERRLHFYLANRCTEAIFVHAGVLEFSGLAMILPASSRRGKTTLTRALLDAGAKFMSDEYAVVDKVGQIHPFPRALSIREPLKLRRDQPSLQQTCLEERKLGFVFASEYEEGRHWLPDKISRGQGILALLAHTVSARANPEFALQCLGMAVENAQCFSSSRGEAEETAERILQVASQSDGENGFKVSKLASPTL